MITTMNDFNGGGPHKSYNFKFALGDSTAIAALSIVDNLANATSMAMQIYSSFTSDPGVKDIYPVMGKWFEAAMGVSTAVTSTLFKTRFLVDKYRMLSYISSLAEKVTIPKSSVSTEMKQVGSVDFPIPTKESAGNISVVYLDDDRGTVEAFHRVWQSFPFRMADLLTTNTLSPLRLYSMPLSYTLLSEAGSEEKSRHIFPYVFPIDVEVSGGDATSSDFQKVTVAYQRQPTLLGMSTLLPVIPISSQVNAETTGGGNTRKNLPREPYTPPSKGDDPMNF